MSTDTKTCSLCLRILPRTQFHKNGRYLAGRCKDCTNEVRRTRQKNDPDRQREANRRWRQAHPERVRATWQRWKERHREEYRAYQHAYYESHTKPKRRREEAR